MAKINVDRNVLKNRFLSYIGKNTMSAIDRESIPSTKGQKDFAEALIEELRDAGIAAEMGEAGVVYAKVPATSASRPSIGFVAHIDTPPDFKCEDIHPIRVEKYDGGVIEVNSEKGFYLSPDEYKFLSGLTGHELILSDGTTVLGGDDKAGVAEIVTMLEILAGDPEIEHGDVIGVFSTDEEIGKGMDHLDFEKFDCDFAYTVDTDGNDIRCLDYETVCDGRVDVTVTGKPVHPGIGTGVIRNASILAMEFHSMLPKELDPFVSKGNEGFDHLQEFNGLVDSAEMRYRVANFDEDALWEQMREFQAIADSLNEKYGYPAFDVKMRQTAVNMKKNVLKDTRCIYYAVQAMESSGLPVKHVGIRGRTDGAGLSSRGVPAPNINTGSYNALSYFELVSVDEMCKCTEILLRIVTQ
jgi:tripeptide aminopeptidase